jgi:DNA-binding response OmpR family regulator
MVNMQLKILIIDDDFELRDVIVDLFKEHNFIVFQAENGKQGLGILEKENIDCVLTDVQMPVMNGMEFLKASRAKFGVKPPIFIMTAASIYPEPQFFSEGANGFYDKPVDIDEFVNYVKSNIIISKV